MKTIELEELKQIQLDILSVIDEFCREKGIKYSMGCGTMLGAARHKGYIPWDDDIDIYLLREEYEKLIPYEELLKNAIKDHEIINISLKNKNEFERDEKCSFSFVRPRKDGVKSKS